MLNTDVDVVVDNNEVSVSAGNKQDEHDDNDYDNGTLALAIYAICCYCCCYFCCESILSFSLSRCCASSPGSQVVIKSRLYFAKYNIYK